MTGADSTTGIPSQFTFQYAIDEINKNGGVFVKAFNKKIPLELDLKDNQTDPEKTIRRGRASECGWLFGGGRYHISRYLSQYI